MMLELIIVLSLLISVITDIKYKKVLNKITFPLMGIGLLFNIFDKGLNGIGFSLLGTLTAFVFFMGTNILIKNIGFGDVKLLMGIGACLGWRDTLSVYILSLLSLLVLSLILKPKQIIKAFKKNYELCTRIFINKKLEYVNFEDNKETFIFAPYIAIGYCITKFLGIVYGLSIISFLFQ